MMTMTEILTRLSGLSPTLRRAAVGLMMMLAVPALSGCAETVVGAGATVGLAAFQERGVEGVARDSSTAAQIIAKFLQHESDLTTKVSVDVWEGRAMLTGLVETEELRSKAVRFAWEVNDVKDVINEIQLKTDEGLEDLAYDAWITTKLSTKLTFDSDVWSINYEIETVNGVVYIIGIAQNQIELDRVLAHANDTARVRRVISHVRVANAGGSGG